MTPIARSTVGSYEPLRDVRPKHATQYTSCPLLTPSSTFTSAPRRARHLTVRPTSAAQACHTCSYGSPHAWRVKRRAQEQR